MAKKRIIARLDIKGPNLIKGINLEGLRVIGNPLEYATNYYNQGIDELIFMDSVASLYGRNSLQEIIQITTENIFIPFTVGGGIRTVEDARQILKIGADKIAINTAAVKNPTLITQIAQNFGSQCMVSSIEAKKVDYNKWEVHIENGREPTGIDVIEWAIECEKLGAGELLLTSIDQEGTLRGFDIELVRQVSKSITIPVISSGGFGKLSDFDEIVNNTEVEAIAIASALHYKKNTINEIKEHAMSHNISVRR